MNTPDTQLAAILDDMDYVGWGDQTKALYSDRLKRWRRESVLAMLLDELVQDKVNPQALTPYENGMNAYRRSVIAALTKEEHV